MRFDDEPRLRPLFMEQGDEVYGHTLSPVERFLDEIDNFPRTGLDRPSAPPRTRPAGTSPSSSAGPTFPEAA